MISAMPHILSQPPKSEVLLHGNASTHRPSTWASQRGLMLAVPGQSRPPRPQAGSPREHSNAKTAGVELQASFRRL